MNDKYKNIYSMINDLNIEPKKMELALALGLFYFEEMGFNKMANVFQMSPYQMESFLEENNFSVGHPLFETLYEVWQEKVGYKSE